MHACMRACVHVRILLRVCLYCVLRAYFLCALAFVCASAVSMSIAIMGAFTLAVFNYYSSDTVFLLSKSLLFAFFLCNHSQY